MTPQSEQTDIACPSIQETLKRIARSISACDPLMCTLNLIASEAASLTGASTAAIGLRDTSGPMLEIKGAFGKNADEMRGLRIIAEHALADGAVRTGRPA